MHVGQNEISTPVSGLVSLRYSFAEFDLPSLEIVARRGWSYRLERVSATRVTLSDPSALMSNDDVVRTVSVHGNTNGGHVGTSARATAPVRFEAASELDDQKIAELQQPGLEQGFCEANSTADV